VKARKIVIVGPAHPYRGGMSAFNESLARELQHQGHQVSIFNFKFQYPNWIFPGEKQTTDDPAPPDLTIHRRIHSMLPLNWLKVRNELKKLLPDQVICGYWLPLLGPCFTTILRGLKRQMHVTGIIHNAVPHEKRPGDRYFTLGFLRHLTDAVVLSDAVARDLESLSPSVKPPLKQLFHPIYDVYGKPLDRKAAIDALGLEKSRRYLLFFGFIRSYKGLDILIEAFGSAAIPQDVDLLIAGEFYDNRDKYIQLISQSERSSRIHLHEGYIASEEVKNYFCASTAVILPYRNATQSGITQIAIHFSVPVVSTRVGGIEEYVQDDFNGLLTKSDPSILAEDLSRLFKGDTLDRFVVGQKQVSKKYSWNAFVERLL
jgi:glycosyltransferase involved in cell wall biosynthesis